MTKKAFILIGRSGCGKGTQVQLLEKYLSEKDAAAKILYIQSGKEVRSFSEQSGYTAGLSRATNEVGGLQPEFLIIYLWAGLLVREYAGNQVLLFDGMPRKLHEAGVLQSVFEFYKIEKPQVIHLKVSAAWATERLLARGRHDDNAEDVRTRLGWFDKEVTQVIDFYRNNSFYDLYEVNGEQTPEAVSRELIAKAFAK
jgi:adenylate kinase family enzyme